MTPSRSVRAPECRPLKYIKHDEASQALWDVLSIHKHFIHTGHRVSGAAGVPQELVDSSSVVVLVARKKAVSKMQELRGNGVAFCDEVNATRL